MYTKVGVCIDYIEMKSMIDFVLVKMEMRKYVRDVKSVWEEG